MVDESKMLNDVRDWLEGEGYVLEMEVARKFAARALIQQGVHYVDPQSGRDREIDLVAFLLDRNDTDLTHSVQAFIECKSTTAPWVLFAGEAWANGPWDPSAYAEEGCPQCEEISLRVAQLRRGMTSGYALTEKRKGGVDHAYEALQQVTNAVISQHIDSPAWSGHSVAGTPTLTGFAVAVVVTRSPLIACTLKIDNSIDLKRVGMVEVAVPRTDVPNQEPRSEGLSVMVVNIDCLDEFVARLANTIHVLQDVTAPEG